MTSKFMNSIISMSMDLEAKASPETRSMIPIVQRYFHLEDKSERTAAENEEMKRLEAEINDVGMH